MSAAFRSWRDIARANGATDAEPGLFAPVLGRETSIPFEVRTYNATTIAAMEEADRIASDPDVKSYGSFKELLAD